MGSENSKRDDRGELQRNQTQREVRQRVYSEDEIHRALENQKRMFEAKQLKMQTSSGIYPNLQTLQNPNTINRPITSNAVHNSVTPSAPPEDVLCSPRNSTVSIQTHQETSPGGLLTPLQSSATATSARASLLQPTSARSLHATPSSGLSAGPSHATSSLAGSSYIKPLSAEPSQATPYLAGPSYITSSSAGPSHTRSPSAGPSLLQPTSARSLHATPSSSGPSYITSSAGPSHATSSLAGSSYIKPLSAEPSQATPSLAGPSYITSSSAGPSHTRSPSAGPSHATPSSARPSRATPPSGGPSHIKSYYAGPPRIRSTSVGPSHATPSSAGALHITPSSAGPYKRNQKWNRDQRTRSRSRVNQNIRELSGTVNCVTCKGQLSLHIYQCKNGHSSCEGCKFKMGQCGDCTEPITDMRNITLESTLADMLKINAEERIKCPNAKDGCCLHFKREELQNHLKECPFNIISCPVMEFSGDCSWKGTIKHIEAHFNENHPQHREADVNKEMHIIVLQLDYKVMHLVNIGFHKFLIHIQLDTSLNNIYMVTQYLGTNFSASKWTYEWHVYNKREPRRKFEYIDICKSNATPVSEMINNDNCAVINMDYAKTFLDNGKLTYKFYLKKQFDTNKNIDTTSN